MKKILLLIPILGICSSLLAQAPQVLNVNANQVDGTKDVQISFETTNKSDYFSELNVEVWYRTSPDQTQWDRAMSLWESPEIGLSTNDEFIPSVDGPDGDETVIYSHKIPAGGDTPTVRNIYWKAGDDAHDVKTDQAQVRVVVFYEKLDESSGVMIPSGQVSGWNGIDDGNGSNTSDSNSTAGTDTNSTNNELDIYFLNSPMVGEVTSYTREIAGSYVFEAFYDEPAAHNGYVGTEVKQLGAVYDDAGIWRLDESIGPWQLNPSLFPTLDSVGVYIESNGLVSQGKLTFSDPGAGDGI